MSVAPTSDDDLLRQLPLPLAQLYRRARNGKTPVDRHHNAYYLAEATLKLAASARIGEALLAGLDHQSPLARSLEQLCLPSVGHWVGFLREASDYLRARPDAALLTLASTHEALTRHEALPAVREFAERASRGVDDEQPPIAPEAASQAARRGVMGFFDLVAGYRNQVFGHGAQRPPAFYDELGGLLLAASAEVLRSDALFGGLTLAVARLTSGDSARSLRVEWQGLQGFASLMLATDAVGPEPDPSEEAARQAAGRVYLVARGVRVPLHPLVVYREDRSERERVGFLNRTVEASRSAKGSEVRRCDYLDYATGDLIQEVDARRELTELLARLRGRPATPSDVDRVILESQAGSGETTPPSDLAAGAIIGDFVLEGELGRGGMGVVYRARQRSLNRTVALKVLPPSMAADPVSLGRFRREITALARCEHPNLVKILTSGADGDRHYYAMELVEGIDLAALFEVLAAWSRSARGRLREGHLPAAVSTSSNVARRRQESQSTNAEPLPALEPVAPAPMPTLDSGRSLYEALGALFADAADALAHLHSRGVIHRDVKPANLMLTLDGRRLVVMDLGLAQLRDRSQSLTADGVKFVGTLRYTSPEQLQSNLLEVDERTDVYGLGATLYEMATLAPIFDGDTTNRLIEQVLHQEPKSLRGVEPAIPRDLAAIALHCLDKDRSQRYTNARDLAEDLRHLAAGEPVSVREPNPFERAFKWARRKPTLASAYLLTFVVVILLAFGVSLAFLWRKADGARGTAETALKGESKAREGEKNSRTIAETALEAEKKAREREKKALDEVEIAREKLVRLEYDRTMQVAHQECRDNNTDAALILLEGTRRDLRGWEWTYVHNLCDRELLALEDGGTSVSWSPDGRHIAILGLFDHTARVWDATRGTEITTLKGHAHKVNSASWSPDGKRIATTSDDKTARVWDASSGAEVALLKGHADKVTSVSWSPDGKRIATASDDKTARVWDATSGTEVFTLNAHADKVNSVSWSPDGRRIATASDDKTARVWDATSGTEVFTLNAHASKVTSVSWSPDGKRIATASWDNTARVWDATSGAETVTLKGHTSWVTSMSWSPDGKRIATASIGDSTALLWEASSGDESLRLKGHADKVTSVSWSPDGKRIATASGDWTARVWDATSGTESITFKKHAGEVTSVSWSPDGKRIATASWRSTRIWDANSSAESLTLKGHADKVTSVSWSPDGKRIVTASDDKTARVWDATSGTEVFTLNAHASKVTSVSWSPDGKRIATASWDDKARVWDANSGTEFITFKKHAGDVSSVSWSPDGRHIATASDDKTARVWDATSGSESLRLKEYAYPVTSVSWSPDGRCIATASWDKTARVWDATSGAKITTLHGHTGDVTWVSWSPDGKRIATASTDKTARVWDATSGSETTTLPGHTGDVTSVSWSPDGQRVVTSSADKTARVWDANSGAETFILKGHTGNVLSASWSPDGRRIATASSDKTARVWDARSGAERRAAGGK